ncbi:MAG TPA: hypothetical protein DCQ98_20225 [Planctomycetaceae bacterium]|nr:hypothetical protein [Planctomycetaceae bacterium]HRF00894.1 hypothetical protein [Pirellulaceae bacterium]
MLRFVCVALVAFAGLSMTSGQAPAHSAFKNALQKKYEFQSVSCNACHEKGKPKTERNEFGKAFDEGLSALKFDGLSITEKFESVKDNEAEKKAFEAVMAESFLAVLEEVKTKESSTGETWGAMLEAKSIEGIK